MEILRTTQTGRDAEYATRYNAAVYPAPSKILIGDGTPPATATARLALTALVHQTGEFDIYGAPDRQTDPETGIETVVMAFIVPADFAGIIKEVGVKHSDGLLHRYTPFAGPTGFAKGLGYSQTFYVATLVTDEEPGMATVRFAPMDAKTLADRVVTLINTDPAVKQGLTGRDGVDGKSAYQHWLDAGHTGTEQEFLESLRAVNAVICSVGGVDYNSEIPFQCVEFSTLNPDVISGSTY